MIFPLLPVLLALGLPTAEPPVADPEPALIQASDVLWFPAPSVVQQQLQWNDVCKDAISSLIMDRERREELLLVVRERRAIWKTLDWAQCYWSWGHSRSNNAPADALESCQLRLDALRVLIGPGAYAAVVLPESVPLELFEAIP